MVKNASAAKVHLRYLGQVHDYLFFYDPEDKTTAVARFEHAKVIQLARYEGHESGQSTSSNPSSTSAGASGASSASPATSAASRASSTAP